MESMVKSGYVRMIKEENIVSYISYKELMDYGEATLKQLKIQNDAGQIKLYCACCLDNTLELGITKANVIRVKTNGLQAKHMESCPKSEVYTSWVEEHTKGFFTNEDGKILFTISMPAVTQSKSEAKEKEESEESKEKSDGPHRAPLLEMVTTINSIAWERQTFSKKKEISQANREGRAPDWKYKSAQEFERLFFGITNDIMISHGKDIFPLNNICYRSREFFENEDYKMLYFIYAKIDKITEFKEDRKFQYITVYMPSNKSQNKATVRIDTKKFERMIQGKEVEEEGTHRYLAGYVNRNMFKDKETGEITSDWITLLNGIIFYTSENGLMIQSKLEAKVVNLLCQKHVLFKKPYEPIENYGNRIPSLIIEQRNKKNILLDIIENKNRHPERKKLAEKNPEFECYLFDGNDDLEELLKQFGKK